MRNFTSISSKITESILIVFCIIFLILLSSCNINASELLIYKTPPYGNTKLKTSLTPDCTIIIKHITGIRTHRVIIFTIEQKNTSLREVLKAQNSKAEKKISQAKGETQAIFTRSRDGVKTNHLLSKSITHRLIKYENIKKWNKNHPLIKNGNTPFINNIEGRAPPDFFSSLNF
jgi:hypothetical protein